MPSSRVPAPPPPSPAAVPPRGWGAVGSWLHALQLYGAAGVGAFGWALAALVGWDAAPWVPLWCAGAVLAYNADRLRADAADALNVPRRTRAVQRRRGWHWAAALAAAAALVAVPVAQGNGRALALVALGAAGALGYSLPRRGWRLKDLPVLKTVIPPGAVVAATFTPPWLCAGARADAVLLAAVVLWAWLFLLANMLLCDLRDLPGDRVAGIRSLPVVLGPAGARRGLAGLVPATAGLAAVAASAGGGGHGLAWGLLAGLGPAAIAGLLLATRRPRGEAFYEWWVEGMLFLPALALGVEFLALGLERLAKG